MKRTEYDTCRYVVSLRPSGTTVIETIDVVDAVLGKDISQATSMAYVDTDRMPEQRVRQDA
jgi:hypothetical protein